MLETALQAESYSEFIIAICKCYLQVIGGEL